MDYNKLIIHTLFFFKYKSPFGYLSESRIGAVMVSMLVSAVDRWFKPRSGQRL